MEQLRKHIYKMKNVSKEHLYDIGFYYSSKYSDNENIFYTCKFPVYKYKNKITLECILTVNLLTKDVVIDVYGANMKSYAPFYNDRFCTNNKVLSKINILIQKKLQEFGIERV